MPRYMKLGAFGSEADEQFKTLDRRVLKAIGAIPDGYSRPGEAKDGI